MKLSYRRLLAIVLCLVMCVSLFPASAFATEPVIEEPVITETAEEPAFEEPAAEPVAEEPAEEPVVEEPAAEPVVENEAAEPVVENEAAEPVAENEAAEPVAEEPAEEPALVEETEEELEPLEAALVGDDPVESLEIAGYITRYDYDRFTRNNYWSEAEGRWIDCENWDSLDAWPRSDGSLTVTAVVEGQTYTGTADDVQDALNRAGFTDVGWHSDETPVQLWDVGEHTATFDVGNHHADYTVHVLASPLKSMTVDDVTRYDTDLSGWRDYPDENGNWRTAEDPWRVEGSPDTIHVTIELDGKPITVSGNPEEVRDRLRDDYGIDVEHRFWNTEQVYGETVIPEAIGASFEFGSLKATYTLHVITNPIASLTVSAITRYQNGRDQMWGWNDSSGEWRDEEWYRVACWPHDADVTVTFKDGRAPLSGRLNEIEDTLREEFDIWHDCDDTPENPWGPGEHTATFYVAGFAADYTVHVLDNPIQSLTVDDFDRFDN